MKKSYLALNKTVIFILVFINLCGCTLISHSDLDDANYTEDSMLQLHDVVMYSRADVNLIKSGDSFGYGRSDDIYVALSYIYDNHSLCSRYGCDFEVSPENIVCIKSEGTSSFFSSVFTGDAEYIITVNEESYKIHLSKSKKGQWVVDNFLVLKSGETGDGSE